MPLDNFSGLLQRYGNRFDPEVLAATVEHWSGRVSSEDRAGIPGINGIPDMAYGEHARHR